MQKYIYIYSVRNAVLGSINHVANFIDMYAFNAIY